VAQSGSLFAADSWHNITFAAEEVKDPRGVLPRALAFGSILVILLYFGANLAYLTTLNFTEIQAAPRDLVATAMLEKILPSIGGRVMAILIMISTFGCINSLILSGARAYFAMARDGLFLPSAAKLNRADVPGVSLALQAVWAGLLVLLTTYSPATGYGNLYSDLLEYIISAALMFYILTIAAVPVLRRKRPDAERPYRTWGYPVTPVVYIAGAAVIVLSLFIFRPATTWPGLAIVVVGIPVYFLFRRTRMRERSGR
jgi:APA family basic amino acid/polyamine antiporter